MNLGSVLQQENVLYPGSMLQQENGKEGQAKAELPLDEQLECLLEQELLIIINRHTGRTYKFEIRSSNFHIPCDKHQVLQHIIYSLHII